MNSLLLMSCKSDYLDSDRTYPQLGLLYLKSAVEKEIPSCKVSLRDSYNLDHPEKLGGYDYIGLSVMTPQREESSKILNVLKSNFPETKVIIGGPHALHYSGDVKKQPYDFIVSGDGQKSLINILKGTTQRIQNNQLSRQDWANQPRPDRSSFAARQFLLHYDYQLNERSATTMLTSTGCPMKCTFCEESQTTVRWSPIEKISQELDDIKSIGYSAVYLFDDLFAIAINKVKPIAEELSKRDLIYRCNGQANFFTKSEDFARLLSQTGCHEIAFGHESGSPKILNNVLKQTSVYQNYLSVEFAKKHGLKVKSFLMLGLPGETYQTISDTESFIMDSGIDDFQLSIYYPYKGTTIRDLIDSGDRSQQLYFAGEGLGAYGQKGGKTESIVSTPSLSSEQLLKERNRIVEKYKPKSHEHFFDTHLNSEVEYE